MADQATSGSFVDSTFVNYDRHVVGKVVDGLSDTFITRYMLGVASHFNASNLKASTPKQASKSGKSRYWHRKNQGPDNQNKSTDHSFIPEGFPEDICYSYNYCSCTEICSKKRICHICKNDNEAKQCTKRE